MAWKVLRTLFDRRDQMHAAVGTILPSDDPVALANRMRVREVPDPVVHVPERSILRHPIIPYTLEEEQGPTVYPPGPDEEGFEA